MTYIHWQILYWKGFGCSLGKGS